MKRASGSTGIVRRLRKFAAAYARSKLGMVGLILLAIFGFMAIEAPLLTSFDPLYDTGLADQSLPPFWLSQLQGKPSAPFIDAPSHYRLNSPSELSQWSISTTPNLPENLTATWDGTDGAAPSSAVNATQLGSLLLTFNRTETNFTYPNPLMRLETHFPWPAGAVSPSTFSLWYNVKVKITGDAGFSIAFLARNPSGSEFTLFNSSYVWNDTVIPEQYTYRGPIYASNLTKTLFNRLRVYNDWSPSDQEIASTQFEMRFWFGDILSADPAHLLFKTPGDYAFIVQTRFYDVNGKQPTSIQLHFDDMHLEIKGTTWGLLGLDFSGRDIWSQLVYGSRISLIIGLVASLVAVTLGLLVGVIAGYFGGTVDQVLMRFTDILLTIPFLPLVLVLAVVLASRGGASFTNLIIVLGLLGWSGIARIIRAQVLTVKEYTYVEAAKAMGASNGHILSKHIIPNVSPLIWVNLALAVPGAIVTEAAVSFLGLGDPNAMSWGIILYNAQLSGDYQFWWRFVPAGLCIAFVSLAFLFVGYSLDEILNPKLRAR